MISDAPGIRAIAERLQSVKFTPEEAALAIALGLALAALACVGPNPGNWTPTQGAPGDGVRATIAAAQVAQLTALATEDPQP